ncbi:MAG: amidohydrolase family protein [Proteobacteria bacterium]|nr:amidohydrolase family protein [Pseudomonadota bacterium]
MKKTILFSLVLVFLVQAVVFGLERDEQINAFRGRIQGMLKQGILPVIDVEYHHGSKIENDRLVTAMDRNGVALIWVGPNERLGSGDSIRLNELYPDRFVPTTVHGDGKLWHSSDKDFLGTLEKDVLSGKYFAMGEFEARHYQSSTNSRDIHMPVDSGAFDVVFRLSSQTGIPFLLHHEAEDALLPELERMLTRHPKAKLIWCHVGRNRNPKTWKKFTGTETIRELLKKYPNLYFDLVQSRPGGKYHMTGYLDAIMYDPSRSGGILEPEWKNLFEAFPDRFVIGSDANTGRFNEYDRVMNTFRSIVFKTLRKDVAERIAFKNAWKLMTGKDWEEIQ